MYKSLCRFQKIMALCFLKICSAKQMSVREAGSGSIFIPQNMAFWFLGEQGSGNISLVGSGFNSEEEE